MVTNLNYGDKFFEEQGKVYKFPDFTLEYVGNYQDPVPEDFPNKGSGLFKGEKFMLKSDTSEKELKVSNGTGLLSPRHFIMDNKDYSIGCSTHVEKGLRSIYIVQGKLSIFDL